MIRLSAFALALAATLGALSAGAQPRAPAMALSEEAAGRYEAATRYYTLRRFDDAAREFQSVYALSGRAELLFNIARAFEDGGHPAEAIDAYERFLREGSPGVERATVNARIAALRAAAARPTVAPSVTPPVRPEPSPPVPIRPIPAPPRPEISRALPIGLLAGGGALLLTGVVLGVTVSSSDSDLAGRCPGGVCPFAPEDEVSSGRARAIAADVLGVLGAGAIAAGAVVWFTQRRPVSPPAISAACGRDGCGVMLRGVF